MANYPGGEALRTFNHLVENIDSRGETYPQLFHMLLLDAGSEVQRGVSVHIDNYAAQTGASLFLQECAPPTNFLVSRHGPLSVLYNKTENLVTVQDLERFDWVITEHPDMFIPRDGGSVWKVQAIVDGFRGFELASLGRQGVWTKIKIPRFIREPKLWILEQEYTDTTATHKSYV